MIDSASVADNDYAKFTASGLEGRTASETKTDLSLDNVENTALSTWTGSTNVTTLGTVATGTWDATAVGVTKGGTGLTTVAKGSVLAVNAADTISAVAGVTNGHVLTYDSAANTVGWAAPGHAVGTVTSVGFVGGSGISFSGTNPVTGDNVGTEATFAIDLTANGGLEASAAGDAGTLQVAQGISQHDVAQFDTGVVDDDFLRINGTAVEGRSASEVLSDIGAQAALSFGISSGDVTKCGAGIADNDFLRIDGTTTEGRSASEVLSDIAASPVAGSASIVTTGTLTAGFIQGETTVSTGVLSTGEGGGTKFLREDGDGTCSWQAVPAGVTAGFSIAMAVAL